MDLRIWNRYGTMLIIKSSLCPFDNKMSSTTKLMAKSFESPDEVRTFEKGKVEIVNLGNVIIGRATF